MNFFVKFALKIGYSNIRDEPITLDEAGLSITPQPTIKAKHRNKTNPFLKPHFVDITYSPRILFLTLEP